MKKNINLLIQCHSLIINIVKADARVAETVYEEIRDSRLDAEEPVNDSSWSDEFDETSSNPSDVINYYIQPVNEYENTVLVLYENYMESQGYQDPVCAKDKCKDNIGDDDNNDDNHDAAAAEDDDDEDAGDDEDARYEIPEKTETTLSYDILSNSPVELFLFVDSLDP